MVLSSDYDTVPHGQAKVAKIIYIKNYFEFFFSVFSYERKLKCTSNQNIRRQKKISTKNFSFSYKEFKKLSRFQILYTNPIEHSEHIFL